MLISEETNPRQAGTVEVLVDASFCPGDGHSVSGTVILLAGGCPVQWESRKQSLMALSTTEAELTALGIRASCLAEALKVGELTLNHRVGTSLWAMV